MVAIRLEEMTRRFGETRALDDVTLDFPSGSFTSLLGPSGCGKTTMLRLIAGFEAPDRGTVSFGGEPVATPATQTPPEHRGVGVVFQSYALWPHMDVAGNVAYPLKMRGVDRHSMEARVRAVLSTVGLDGYETRRIEELSGGQRQRVALARCLVADCKVILFDEPLANLDMHLRASMVDAFRDIHRRTRATMIYVTHDQAEALALSDRIAVMDRGRVLQIASPTEIYRTPGHARVAEFVGRGALLDADLVERRDHSATVHLGGETFVGRMAAAPDDGRVRVLLRPEGLGLSDAGLPAVVMSTIYRGPVFEVILELVASGQKIVLDSVDPVASGELVRVAVSDAWIIPA